VGRLVRALTRADIKAEATREPGGSAGAEAIRDLLLGGETERWDAVSEALLLFAARRDHVFRLIRPALDAGTWMIGDRFADSTLAYQGYGRGLPLAELQTLHSFALGDFAPDLTLILDLPVDEGLSRAGRRSMLSDRFERLELEFHQRLRDGFRQIAAANPNRCVLIDASGDIETVHRTVLSVVTRRLGVVLKL
jgi:dTMP kinase